MKNNILPKDREYNILFIGNSYTYYNHMPEEIFSNIAHAAGYTKVKVTSITKGGWYLDKHADPEDECGALVLKALKENKYDCVILQEQSICPIGAPERFYDGARALASKIKDNGAHLLFYSTWGRRADNATLEERGWTNESMTWELAAAYGAIADELCADVAYVGLAFFDIYTKYAGKIELYHTDGTHPSPLGSTLAALTIFSKIFGTDPTAINCDIPLPEEYSDIIKNAAKKAVFDAPMIPDEYKRSSLGVTKNL